MPYVVHKHIVHADRYSLSLPADAEALWVEFQGDDICLWERHMIPADHATEMSSYGPSPRAICVVGTGHAFNAQLPHVGSAQHREHRLVVHVFMEKSPLADLSISAAPR